MDSAEKSAKSNKKNKRKNQRSDILLDNCSRRNNGSLTNNDDTVGTIE